MNQLWHGVVRALTRSTARGPNVTGARPGGQLRHFCEPE